MLRKNGDVRQQSACVSAVNGLRGSSLQTRFMELNGKYFERKLAYESEAVISRVKVNVENVKKKKGKVKYGC